MATDRFGNEVQETNPAPSEGGVDRFGNKIEPKSAFEVAAGRVSGAVKPAGGRKESEMSWGDIGRGAAHFVHGVSLHTSADMAGLLAKQGMEEAGAIGEKPADDPEKVRLKVRAGVQNFLKESAKESPVATTLGDIAGQGVAGMAIPTTTLAKATPALSKLNSFLYETGKVGGVMGAVTGAADAPDGLENKIRGGATGFLEGVPGGMVGGAVGHVLGGAVRSTSRQVADAAERAFATRVAAQRLYYGQGAADIAAGRGGFSEREFNDLKAKGVPVIAADIFGDQARAVSRWAGTVSPEAAADQTNFANKRFHGQAERGEQEAHGLVGGARRSDVEDAAKAQYDALRGHAYKDAYDAGDFPIGDNKHPEIQRLMSSNHVADALKQAAAEESTRTVAAGGGAFNPKVTITQDGRMLFRTKGGTSPYPNLEMWDATKQKLDAMIARAKANDKDTGLARNLTIISRDLRKALDDIVPGYEKARGVAEHYFGTDDLLEAGKTVNNMAESSLDKFRKIMAQTPQSGKDLIRVGHAQELADRLGKAVDKTEATNRVFNTPTSRRAMEVVHGPLGVDRMEMWQRRENIMNNYREGTGTKNSWTARNAMDALAMGTVGSAIGGYFYGKEGAGAGLTSGVVLRVGVGKLLRNSFGIERRLANHIAELALSRDLNDAKKFVDLATGNPKIGKFVRFLDNILDRAPKAGAAAGSIGAQNFPSLTE